jgi:NAD(P)-dependent dehydrogenase (short-subunit alcohol dehydrogenase family)
MKDLKDKVAVITGGATGIGLALSLELVKQGTKVVIASTTQEKLDEAEKTILEAGGDVLAVQCDVSDKASVQNLHDVVAKKYGEADIVVANAGVTTSGWFHEHRQQDWDW